MMSLVPFQECDTDGGKGLSQMRKYIIMFQQIVEIDLKFDEKFFILRTLPILYPSMN